MESFLVDPSGYVLTRWVFLRLLGVIYLIAFASFRLQAGGLIGEKGILPAGKFLAAVKQGLGIKGYLFYPTLAWLDAGNASIRWMCLAGIFLSVLLIFGLQTTPVLVFLWILYLSLANIGQVFLSYQWDVLLMETGFLSIFIVPPSLLPGQANAPPSLLVIVLFRWLLFRLMFMSGVVKLASRDPVWKNLTALAYHYETQPLPTPLAWRMHQAPLWFHKLSTLVTLFTELLVPIFFFAPDPLRYAAGGLTVLLQILIMFTGNYTFFNLLTIFLAVFLLDDRQFQAILPAGLLDQAAPAAGAAWGNTILIPLVLVSVVFGCIYILMRLVRGKGRLASSLSNLRPVLRVMSALHIVNPYGLFAVMTTRRPEIIVEGSHDARQWLPYEFKYKPGDLKRAPPIVAPHQPRLDWQMWFAALGNYPENPWFLHFAEGLLSGCPEVTRLLAKNPFPDRPPTYLRAVLYEYHFTTAEEKARGGTWWRREALGMYLPVISKSED